MTFIPFVLPGETVEARVVEEKKGFARAELVKAVRPSEARVEPPCQYFGRCGGCHLQHASYESQLQFKQQILRETIERTARMKLDAEIQAHPSPPLAYRNRTRMHVDAGPDFRLGYFRHSSHDLFVVEECPISSPLINRAIGAIWKIGRKTAVPHEITEIEFFVNERDDQLLLAFYLRRNGERKLLLQACEQVAALIPELVGGSSILHMREGKRNANHGAEGDLIFGEPFLKYRTKRGSYRVSVGSFFQTNRFLIDDMVDLVVADRRGRIAWDLYAGVGLFSLGLAANFDQVVAVESFPASVNDLKTNAPPNLQIRRNTTEDYLARADKQVTPDVIVVDPPRAGLEKETAQTLAKIPASEIVYVSCDPATLGRDLAIFNSLGWRMAQVHMLDLFPQTFHIETVVILER